MTESPKKPELKKRQHIVPQIYLKRFADADECFFAYDKLHDVEFSNKVCNVAYEKFFYDIISAGLARQEVENYLATIEGQYRTAIEDLLGCARTGAIPPSVRDHMSSILMLQVHRGRRSRAMLEQMMNMGSEDLRLVLESQGAKDLPDLSFLDRLKDEEVALLQSLFLDMAWLQHDPKSLAQHIWMIGTNDTETRLYTSDAPVVIEGPGGVSAIGTDDIIPPKTVIRFPLSPQHELRICHRGSHPDMEEFDGCSIKLSTDDVIVSNRLQVVHCDQQIYSLVSDFAIAKQDVKDHPEIREPTRFPLASD